MSGIGIDFGTSNSVAALYDGKDIRLINLEDEDAIMPTAIHLNRELQTKTGQKAINQYISENINRIVELTPEVIAKTTVIGSEYQSPSSEGDGSNFADVFGKPIIDRGMPGRLFRGIKRLLGTESLRRLMVFDRPFRLVALVTPIFLQIRKSIERDSRELINTVHCGHPVIFEGGQKNSNSVAFSKLSEACSYAGFSNVTFYPEPVAATLSYLHSNKSLESGNVLAFDFGGGTMDLSVIHFEGTRFKVLATEGLPLGGDHIDQLLFKEFVSPALGKGERWSRVRDGKMIESEFPFDEIEEKLLNWTVTYMLNQNQYRSNIVERINQGGPSAKKFERLLDLITNNYSYLVFQEIRKAKAAISTNEFCQIDIPELDLIIEISRREFDKIISSMLHQIETAIDNVLKKSNTEPNDIAVVVRTGGSSQIASVKTMLGEKFPDKVVEHNPFTSVAIGLAIASYHSLDFELD